MSSLLNISQISDVTGISEENIPNDLITWAEKRVEKKLGKTYTESTNTESRYLYEKTNILKLEKQNIVSVSSFTIEDVHESELSEDDEEYKLFKEEGIIKCDLLVPFEKIDITYTYGGDSVEDLDRYLHLLLILKQLIVSYPDRIPKEEISEKIGDYSVNYNVTELKSRPELIDKEIESTIQDIDEDDLYFF